MYPWLFLWAPQLQLPFSGDVAQRIEPRTQWFFDGIDASAGDGRIERRAFEVASYGRQLGLLAEVLVEATRRGEDIGAIDVLERYQSWRRFDSTSLALGMDTVNKVFSNDNPILRAGRDLGMGLVQAFPGLRRGFMRQAAGLSGPLPRLSQSQRFPMPRALPLFAATVSTVLIGARNEEQLKQNLGAVGWNLTPEQVAKLDKASQRPKPYPYWHQAGFAYRNPTPV